MGRAIVTGRKMACDTDSHLVGNVRYDHGQFYVRTFSEGTGPLVDNVGVYV